VLSEFAPETHSLIKPVRIPVIRLLFYVTVSPVNSKFLRHSDFKYWTDRRTARNTLSSRYKCTLSARRRASSNAQNMDNISSCSRKNRRKSLLNLRLESGTNADHVRFEGKAERTNFEKTPIKTFGAL